MIMWARVSYRSYRSAAIRSNITFISYEDLRQYKTERSNSKPIGATIRMLFPHFFLEQGAWSHYINVAQPHSRVRSLLEPAATL